MLTLGRAAETLSSNTKRHPSSELDPATADLRGRVVPFSRTAAAVVGGDDEDADDGARLVEGDAADQLASLAAQHGGADDSADDALVGVERGAVGTARRGCPRSLQLAHHAERDDPGVTDQLRRQLLAHPGVKAGLEFVVRAVRDEAERYPRSPLSGP